MKIHCRYRGIKGFVTIYNRAVRYAYMITKTALKRVRILDHWKHHGMKSTIDAFEVSERTLWDWKGRLDNGGGKPESLNPRSKAPKEKRKRLWDFRILEEIKRLRGADVHPNLGAEKLYPLLLDFCDTSGITGCPKPSTIERLITDMGGLRTFPQKVTHFGKVKRANRQKVLRKPKDLIPAYPGHVMALDTIEKQRNGRRMYILTAIDIYTRTTFSIATRSHSSKTFAHFFFLIMKMFPYEIKNVLTDNGSEFKLHLSALLTKNKITHYHTYPKTPKMNAHCESFNGTIQEEFVDYHVNLLFDDTTKFNEKMKVYVEFYNTKRVHCAFDNKKAPLEVLTESEYYLEQLPAECRNGWGYSRAGLRTPPVLYLFYKENTSSFFKIFKTSS
jgi:transposase InsO family protein